jgi:hypothetical protein
MRRLLLGIVLVTTVVLAPASGAVASSPGLDVLAVQQVVRQTVPTPPGQGNQSGVTLQAAVAADPSNPRVAVAATAEGRAEEQGGSAALGYAWTRTGGARWHSGVLEGVTTATGGRWEATNWPTVAFGPHGTAYLAGEVRSGCASGIALARSSAGAGSFSEAQLVEHPTAANSSSARFRLGPTPAAQSLPRHWVAGGTLPFRPDGNGTVSSDVAAPMTAAAPMPPNRRPAQHHPPTGPSWPSSRTERSFSLPSPRPRCRRFHYSHDGGRSFAPVVTVRDLINGGPPEHPPLFPRSPPTPRPGTCMWLQRCVRYRSRRVAGCALPQTIIGVCGGQIKDNRRAQHYTPRLVPTAEGRVS